MMLKVVHGPVNIGNQAFIVSKYENLNGIYSRLVVHEETWLKYKADKTLNKLDESGWKKALNRCIFSLHSLMKYNVFHYYFGRSFFWAGGAFKRIEYLDLKLARKLGKKIIVTFQGCDARIASLSDQQNEWTPCREGNCASYKDCVGGLDDVRQKFINDIIPLADYVIYLNPELGHYLPDHAQFWPYASVDIEEISSYPPKVNQRKPVIVHAPTDMGIKGSNLIMRAIDQLKNEFDFEFRLIQGLPFDEAMEAYKDADIVIDQVLTGWYGGLAVELMTMGKPIICYIRQNDMSFVDEEMLNDMPIYKVSPACLYDDLKAVLKDKENWQARGQKGISFVNKWHNPRLTAKKLIDIYSGKAG